MTAVVKLTDKCSVTKKYKFTYFVDSVMNLPDSDSEDELPPGWEERVTSDGSVFYAKYKN